MHKVHAGYTLIAKLRPGRAEAVSQLLSDLRTEPERLPFGDTTTTHFASIVVIPAQPYDNDELPATLMLATSFCGPAEIHVEELIRVMGGELRTLLSHCLDFDPACSDKQLAKFFRRHRRADTFYSGMQHLSPEDVRRQIQLRSEIENFVDAKERAGGFVTPDPATKHQAIHRQIQDHIRTLPGFEWAQEPTTPAPGTFVAMTWRVLILYALLVPYLLTLVGSSIVYPICRHPTAGVVMASSWLALVLFLLFVFGLFYGVREAEELQKEVADRPEDEWARSLAATQNHPVINEMTVAGPIKEGRWRPLFLRMALWIVARIATGLPWIKAGGLDEGINIPTVATARWITIDGGRRLIFISNFTNAAVPYVRDFIDTIFGAMRINLTFGFGGGYPPTRFILLEGALKDPNAFIYVVGTNMLHTDFWYCPYKDISIDNIKLNRKIRESLFADLDEDHAKEWLHLL